MNVKKEVILGNEATDKLIAGLDIMANTVKCTLGPKGRHVMVLTSFDTPHITKDGVTVARSIKIKNPAKNLGAMTLLQAAEKTVREAGDGTTTSIVLAQSMVHEAVKLLRNGVDVKTIRKVMDSYFTLVVDYIKSRSKMVRTVDDVYDVALVSSNGDEKLSGLIREAYVSVGLDGIIATADSNSPKSYVETTSGLRFDKGYISHVFINNSRNGTVEYENPLIFVCDTKLRYSSDIAPVLNIAAEAGRPIVIIADDVEAQALATAMVNKVKGNMPVVCVKAPSYGQNRYNIMEDIAIYTNGTVVSEKAGMHASKVTREQLGECDRIVINQTQTTIIGGKGNPDKIESRIEAIKGEYDNAPTKYHEDKAMERIAMLKSKIATIYVGGHTDIEVRELKDRLDDTIHAAKAAIEDGIISGGGSVLYDAYNHLDKDLKSNPEYTQVFSKSLKEIMHAPLKVLCENSDASFDVVKALINTKGVGYGFNANTGEVEKLDEIGVVDPTKVLISALNNAFSVSSMLLSTHAIVIQPSLSRDDVANM